MYILLQSSLHFPCETIWHATISLLMTQFELLNSTLPGSPVWIASVVRPSQKVHMHECEGSSTLLNRGRLEQVNAKLTPKHFILPRRTSVGLQFPPFLLSRRV